MNQETRKENGEPMDLVKHDIRAAWTKFVVNGKKQTCRMKSQGTLDCRVMASYDDGVVSITVPSKATMVSVRLDELTAILHEASIKALEVGSRLTHHTGETDDEVIVDEG